MFDKLITWLQEIIGLFQFWTTLYPFERGIRYRLGRWTKELEPGPHLIFPFNIDEVIVENVVPEGRSLGNQSITLKDGTPLTLNCDIMYRITSIDHFLNNIEDADTVLGVMLPGLIQRILFQYTWEELLEARSLAVEDGRRYTLEKKLQAEMNRILGEMEWGIEITMVAISQFVRTSLRDSVHRIL